MSEIAAMIVGSEKLTSIFGRWPSFHDAEVHEIHFWRRHVDTEAKVYNFPVLTVKIHLWLTTNEVNERGYYVLTNHTLRVVQVF
jgi:Immunity protein 50